MLVVLIEGGGPHTATPGNTADGIATYTTHTAWGYRLRFSYPSEWRHREWREITTSLTAVLTYVSSGPQHDPCHLTDRGLQCGTPFNSLRPDGVLATWSAWSLPGRTPGRVAAAERRPSGLFVWITVRPATRLGADERITARIARSPGSSLWWQLTALLRGPGLRHNEAAVRRMLSSAELLPVTEPV